MPREPQPTEIGLTTQAVAALLGIAASTLNYWVQLELVKPSISPPDGHRVQQWWSVEDVVSAQTIRRLRLAGVSLQSLRRLANHLAANGHLLSSVRLLWDGRDIEVLLEDGSVQSGLSHPGQQALQLNVLPIEHWRQQAAALAQEVPKNLQEQADSRAERRRARQDDLEKRLLGKSGSPPQHVAT